ncbi:hypothetical protein ACTXT7_000082 [Hymenolepis weldensis]
MAKARRSGRKRRLRFERVFVAKTVINLFGNPVISALKTSEHEAVDYPREMKAYNMMLVHAEEL